MKRLEVSRGFVVKAVAPLVAGVMVLSACSSESGQPNKSKDDNNTNTAVEQIAGINDHGKSGMDFHGAMCDERRSFSGLDSETFTWQENMRETLTKEGGDKDRAEFETALEAAERAKGGYVDQAVRLQARIDDEGSFVRKDAAAMVDPYVRDEALERACGTFIGTASAMIRRVQDPMMRELYGDMVDQVIFERALRLNEAGNTTAAEKALRYIDSIGGMTQDTAREAYEQETR